jgi:glycosyltransferase involved in cell wall biosynthesis
LVNTPFSTIISVYANDRFDWFREAINSIENQTTPPHQIIIVKDGPIEGKINDYITDINKSKNGIDFSLYETKTNLGRGNTLNPALKMSKYDYVSIMDADDIARIDRFEMQLNFFNNNPDIDVLGGWIEEFENRPKDIGKIRKVYSDHYEIMKSSRNYCPMNNVTVMFKKAAVLSVGGYEGGIGVQEDYILWIKMLTKGFKFANIDKVLVDVRVGNGLQSRRGGVNYVIEEIKMQQLFYDLKHISFTKMIFSITMRSIVRLMPQSIRRYIYLLIRIIR